MHSKRDVAWLRRFAILAAIAAAAVALVNVVLWVTWDPTTPPAGALVGSGLAAWMALTSRLVAEGRELRSVVLMSAGISASVLLLLPIAPGSSAAIAFALVVPVFFAAPYLTSRQMLVLSTAVWVVGLAYVMAGAQIQMAAGTGGSSPTGIVLNAVASAVIMASMLLLLRRYRLVSGELRHMSRHDGLTGLPDRAFLVERLHGALVREGRRPSTTAVVDLDLVGFEQINYRHGHASGDEVLRAVAHRLRRALRATDTIARVGGDEFAILLEDFTDRASTIVYLEGLLEALAIPVELPDATVLVSVNAGVAFSGDADASAEALLRDAQHAMYQAKRDRDQGLVVYDPLIRAREDERRSARRKIRGIAERGELRLQFQPVVQLQGGDGERRPFEQPADSIVALEALVRWEHPEDGTRMPDDFISLAEETGDIVRIGRWVLGAACEQLRSWQSLPLVDGLRMMVNISASELDQRGFEDDVERIVAASGISPDKLVFELTEHVLVRDNPRTHAVLRRLRSGGIHLAVDDFGTGYSSLSYLKDLPVDILKMDRAFLSDAIGSARAVMMVKAMIHIGAGLGATVVAEGIESEEQLQLLRSLGCDLGQGHFLAPPRDAPDTEALLRAGHRPWDRILKGPGPRRGRGGEGHGPLDSIHIGA